MTDQEILTLYYKHSIDNGDISIQQFANAVKEAIQLTKSKPKKEIDFGWDCSSSLSPTGKCDYWHGEIYNEDCCKYCGEPDERK